jgi:quercetin dioxygenase-like cupin family protein
LLLAFTAVAQEPQAVELTSEPSHHLVFENAFLRAFDVKVAPKTSTLVHRHNHDYVYVALGDADITNARVGAQPVKAVLKDGDARFAAGPFSHAAINNADTVFRNITIELLSASTNEHNCSEACSQPCPPGDNLCPTVQQLFSADQWTVTTVTLPPGGKLPSHTHYAHHLLVPITDLHLKVKNQDQPETEINARVGEVSWVNPVIHTVTNIGPKPARFVTLELRGTAEHAGAPSHP